MRGITELLEKYKVNLERRQHADQQSIQSLFDSVTTIT